jgi:hypothetical protein
MAKTPVEAMLDQVEWKILPPMDEGETPHATHSGVLRIGNAELKCYQLSNGQSIFDADDLMAFFGMGGI